MKTVIKTTIATIAIALGSISVAQADNNRHERGYDKPRQQKHFRENEGRHEWKHANNRKERYREDRHYLKHRGDRHVKIIERPRWKRSHKRVEKHIYRDHGRRRVEKHVYKHGRYAPPRRFEKHVYHHGRYAPPRRVVKKVVIQDRHHHNNALPVLAGGLIGSAIGHDIGHGDPVATFSGAIFGAMVGDALRH